MSDAVHPSPAAAHGRGATLVAVGAAVAAILVREAAGVDDGPVKDWTLPVCDVVAVLLCAWRVVAVPAERVAWALVATGLASYTLGAVVFAGWIRPAPQAPWPSHADALWLAAYPFFLAGLAVLARPRELRRGVPLALDGLIGALATSVLVSLAVFEPLWERAQAEGVIFAFSYPLADTMLAGFIVMLFAGRGWHLDRRWLLLGAALLLLTCADNLYVVASIAGGWAPGGLNDLPYAVSILLLPAAAWSPAAHAPALEPWRPRAVAYPIAAALVAVVTAIVAQFAELSVVTRGLVSAALLAIVLRLAVAFRSYRTILGASRSEALTDQLTGLGNRRRLLDDLDRRLDGLPAPFGLAFFDLDGFKGYNDAFGHAAGDALLVRLARRLAAAVGGDGSTYRMGGDEFCALVRGGSAEVAATVERAAAALVEVGDGFTITSSHGVALLPEEADRADLALRLADQRMYAWKNVRPQSTASQTRDVLVRVLDAREPALHAHVLDVGQLALRVGRRLGVPEDALPELVHAAELHDVGKIAVPDSILSKPGPLDDAEWAFMRRHTLIGERFLLAVPALRSVAALVRSSHERWDGSGYPDGLAGEAIPLGARIIAVCDAFDAMVTDRAYRPGRSRDEALAELRRCAGTQFDPRVVAALLDIAATRAAADAAVR